MWGSNGGYNNSQDRISDRDRLERDEKGNLRGQRGRDGNRDHFGNGRGYGRNDYGGNRGGGGKKGIFALCILVVLIIFGISGTGGFGKFMRTFNSTPEENMNSMFTSVKKLEADNKRDGRPYDIYDHNNLYGDKGIKLIVDKEYAVYVYTEDEEANEPFNTWVKENENTIPIYRLDMEDIEFSQEVASYREDGKPMVLVYNEVERGHKELDGVIKDPELLDEIVPHIQEIINEKEGIEDETEGTTEKEQE